MQAGDIIFVAETGFIPDMIRLFDHGPYDHVCMAVSDTEIVEAQYGQKVNIKPFPYAHTKHTIISLGLTDKEKASVRELVNPFLGEGYDLPEIASSAIRLLGWEDFDLFDEKNEVICSELIGYLTQRLGKADKGTQLLAPNHLFNYFVKKKYKVLY